MRKLLAILLLLSASAFAATPVAVTGTVQSIDTSGHRGNAFVRFKLRNFAGFVPRVTGTGIVVQTVIDKQPAADGTFSQNLWSNDDIVPNTCGALSNEACTFYTIEFWNDGKITSSGNYCIPAGGSYDLNTATVCQAPPLPPNFVPLTILFETDGVGNGSQVLLNLISGTGIDLNESGGGVTVNVTGTIPNLTVSTGVAVNGGGLKHKRSTAGCATAASVGAVCTTVVTWTTPFADVNYTAQCGGRVITSGVPAEGGLTAQSASTVTFQTVATTAAAAQFTNIDCVAFHD